MKCIECNKKIKDNRRRVKKICESCELDIFANRMNNIWIGQKNQ